MTNQILCAKIVPLQEICWRGSMAEQLICNQQVDGSTPFASSILATYGRFPERPKGADCKSVVTDFGGPNPPSPTKKEVTFVYQKLLLFLSIAKAMAYHHALACISSPQAYIINRRLYRFRNDDIQNFVLMICRNKLRMIYKATP